MFLYATAQVLHVKGWEADSTAPRVATSADAMFGGVGWMSDEGVDTQQTTCYAKEESEGISDAARNAISGIGK